MNVLIIADIEGIVGVVNMNDIEQNNNLMTKEVLSVCLALKRCGVDNIDVCDAHNEGKNIDRSPFTDIDVNVISQVWNVDLSVKYDAALLVGYHGMNGSDSVFAHTLKDDVEKVKTNSSPIGEVGIFMSWLNESRIPVIFVSGDEQATSEAIEQDSNCYTFTKKNIEAEKMTLENLTECYYEVLKHAIQCFKKGRYKTSELKVYPLYMYLENPGMLPYIRSQEKVMKNAIIFESSTDLVSGISEICEDINKAKLKILKENIEYAKNLRMQFSDIDVRKIENNKLIELLNKDVTMLQSGDKKYIWETLTCYRNSLGEVAGGKEKSGNQSCFLPDFASGS